MIFGEVIINWYRKNSRELPWRDTRDPYKIWLSEIILQQTRIDQGLAYYHRFIRKFPTIKRLAAADEGEVLKLWQGLGYYSRARNLHHTAKEIVERYAGKFPSTHQEVLALKGIGDYTAGAIMSFAYHEPYPLVDGNVFRLLSRYFGIKTPVDSSKAKKEFFGLAGELIKGHPPEIFNQAIMEFGARQCKPQNPDCPACPLNSVCIAFSRRQVHLFPVKENKVKVRNRYFHYLVIRANGKTYINKRVGNDIWKNLYDFPLIETVKKVSETKLMKTKEWEQILGNAKITVRKISHEYRHLLSHQAIHAKFYEMDVSGKNNISRNSFIPVSAREMKKFAIPKLVENFMEGKK